MSARASVVRGACILTVCLLVAGASPWAPRNAPPAWFWGCWRVKRLIPVTDISGLSPAQVKALIGERLFFGRACACSGRTLIRSPRYSVRVLSNREFFAGYYIPLTQIGVHSRTVTEVQVALPPNLSDLDFPGSDVYLRARDIVIAVEGDFFEAQKTTSGAHGCACGERP